MKSQAGRTFYIILPGFTVFSREIPGRRFRRTLFVHKFVALPMVNFYLKHGSSRVLKIMGHQLPISYYKIESKFWVYNF